MRHQIPNKGNNKLPQNNWIISIVVTFLMCKHLAVSVKPTISSGEQTLMNGKSEFLASCAAKAVFPAFGGPSRSTDTKPKQKAVSANYMKQSNSNDISKIINNNSKANASPRSVNIKVKSKRRQ